jgi:hypothetical protein
MEVANLASPDTLAVLAFLEKIFNLVMVALFIWYFGFRDGDKP